VKLHFKKYQGTGNDFIIIDNRQHLYDQLDVAFFCHPKFGIGGDGLMLLQNKADYDFEMVYYNSDGNISTMCGNGGRCIVDFAKRLGVFEGYTTRFKAVDGPHDAIWDDDFVELKMQDVHSIDRRGKDYVLNTGSPHYVVFANAIDTMEIVDEASLIRYNNEFSNEGINVNFVEILSATEPYQILVRTYERGVEDETLSCGTGVTASAIAMSEQLGLPEGNYTIGIQTPGGNLVVKFEKGNGYNNVWLCGAATEVFTGEIDI
jgi:diaminopimelate epimerase